MLAGERYVEDIKTGIFVKTILAHIHREKMESDGFEIHIKVLDILGHSIL